MKGSKCKCGYATTSGRRKCPKCGKAMSAAEWPDEGTVLSYTELQVVPDGLAEPYDMVLVAIPKGPKVICWASRKLNQSDEVVVTEKDGRFFCNLKSELRFDIDEEQVRSG